MIGCDPRQKCCAAKCGIMGCSLCCTHEACPACVKVQQD
jgi:hypothetical protein